MKEKMIEYFEQEIQCTKLHLACLEKDGYYTPYSIVERGITRCFGVATFCQQFVGEETEEIYNKYRKRLEDLLK